MFNAGFSSLAGILCAGYFIHQCSLPIIANAKEPEKVSRNVFLGYLMVFFTYSLLGLLGYYGFTGVSFKDHFLEGKGSKDEGIIDQNYLTMFKFDSVPAIVVRLLIWVQLSCSYPLVNHFQRTILMNLIYKTTDVTENQFRLINVSISLVSLFFGVFYPKPGSILGYAGAVSGFLMIYLIPVITYLKMKKVEIENPLLAAAIQENEVKLIFP